MMLSVEKKRIGLIAAVAAVTILTIPFAGNREAQAATKNVTMTAGQTKNLTIKKKKKVKWSSSNTSVVTVKKTGNNKAKLTARKAGTANVTAKVGKKKYTYKVTVKEKAIVKKIAINKTGQSGNARSSTGAAKAGSTNQETAQVAAASNTSAVKTPTGGNIAGALNTSSATYLVAGQYVTGTYNANMAAELVSLINEYRSKNGRSKLLQSEVLTKAAGVRAREITLPNWFSHTRPDGSSNFTVSPYASGENLARGFESAQAIFNAWKSSPTHNTIMLSKDFKAIGIAIFEEEFEIYGITFTSYYAVLEAGR